MNENYVIKTISRKNILTKIFRKESLAGYEHIRMRERNESDRGI